MSSCISKIEARPAPRTTYTEMFVLIACAFTVIAVTFFFVGVYVAEMDYGKTNPYKEEMEALSQALKVERQRVNILERENEDTRDANQAWYEKVETLTVSMVTANLAAQEMDERLKLTWVILSFSIFMLSVWIYGCLVLA